MTPNLQFQRTCTGSFGIKMIRFWFLLLFSATTLWSATAQSRVEHEILEVVIRNEFAPSTLLLMGNHKQRCLSIKSRTTATDRDPDADLMARFSADHPPFYPGSTCAKRDAKALVADLPLLMWVTDPIFLTEDEAEVRLGYYFFGPGDSGSGYAIRIRRQGERWKVVARIQNYPKVIAQ
jgi:hypothetical protein